jgi:hypothetical protein
MPVSEDGELTDGPTVLLQNLQFQRLLLGQHLRGSKTAVLAHVRQFYAGIMGQ